MTKAEFISAVIDLLKRAVEEEREACAKAVLDLKDGLIDGTLWDEALDDAATAIRARDNSQKIFDEYDEILATGTRIKFHVNSHRYDEGPATIVRWLPGERKYVVQRDRPTPTRKKIILVRRNEFDVIEAQDEER